MTQRYYYRMGAMAAFVGTVLLLLGTLMHPSHADPNDAAAAFAEYAADQHWIASHLAQLLGLGLLMVVLMILARFFRSDLGIVLTEVGKTGAIISIAVGAVLQAVDGIAIKAMSGYWANAALSDKAALFAASLGVRQIEIGLASMLSLFSGVTVLLYGVGMLINLPANFALLLWALGLGVRFLTLQSAPPPHTP